MLQLIPVDITPTTTTIQSNYCYIANATLFPSVNQWVELQLYPNEDIMKLTYSGPSDVWYDNYQQQKVNFKNKTFFFSKKKKRYGIGFGNNVMNGTYAIIIDGYGNVTERMLGNHEPGILLNSTVTLLAEKLVDGNGTRVVILQRALHESGSHYYNFASSNFTTIPIIFAYGRTPTLNYHQDRNTAVLFLQTCNGDIVTTTSTNAPTTTTTTTTPTTTTTVSTTTTTVSTTTTAASTTTTTITSTTTTTAIPTTTSVPSGSYYTDSLILFANMNQQVELTIYPDSNTVEIVYTGPVNLWLIYTDQKKKKKPKKKKNNSVAISNTPCTACALAQCVARAYVDKCKEEERGR
ncbi:collagen-binding protein A [Reticulomyxa filosa]|uniref:Collagen-binding protein A n=1 Tax=Reticulomyxa filosa TaxID=46433 RepID=X6NW93_RETFI|nr:collagen-binding protein A [Reticulomyxa filosa]|eukprot:ETO30153.1 collagen-binding protein A [Reticulomyxa filosa]